ncbi:MAG TPA: glycoside hydrolase family 97 catalytic domain-containing protein, partial [Calditrichia bacterium]|nr:glycoside hydrolase family 97 catalytic domain-containing protein [Calditrichia bacterium]
MKFSVYGIPLFLMLLLPALFAGEENGPASLKSPDGNIEVIFSLDQQGQPVYRIVAENAEVIGPSRLGLIRADGDFSRQLTLKEASGVSPVQSQYHLLHGKKSDITYRANRRIFHLENPAQQAMEIIFQVSDDGVAFRYRFPEESGDLKKIEREISRFQLAPEGRAWIQPMSKAKTGWEHSNPSYEEHYRIGTGLDSLPPAGSGWVFPALFHTAGKWVLLSETAPDRNYCGSRLRNEAGNGLFYLDFPEAPEIFPGGVLQPHSTLPWETPWRIAVIGDLATVVESTLGTDLAEPGRIRDTEWIRPGRASWSWVLLKDDSTVFDVQKRFVDYAARMGWEYCLVDADWDTKIGYDKIAELADYAAAQKVGLILWYNSAGDWNTTPYHPRNRLLTRQDRIDEFRRLHEMGIKGVKVDFFGGDGQSMMSYYQDIFEAAAAFQLVVNCHGATLPRGWQRTYPNLLSMESIKGFEFVTFEQGNADLQPSHSAVIPFTRNVFDPMDFTPMAFSEVPNIERRTSGAFELATAIVFQSGVQHYAETPRGMARVPAFVRDFVKAIPPVWEDIRFLDGFPGQYAVLARKSGENWFIGGLNGQ